MRNYSIDFNAYTIDGLSDKYFQFSVYGLSELGSTYDPRIVTTATVNTTMFSDRTTSGANSKTYGYLELENSDGALDYMVDYILEGRRLDATLYPNNGTANRYITTVIDSVEFTMTRVVLNLRDYISELDKPVLTEVYGGSNVLPDGVDGTDDIKGQIKPWALGTNFLIEPVLVNTVRFIYQVSVGQGSIPWVYDKGVALTLQTPDFLSIADMQTGSVTAGSYRVYNGAEGLFFKLGVTPNGIITCFAVGSPFGAYGTVSSLVQEVLTTGWFSQNLSGAMPPFEAGMYLKDSSTYRTVISDLTMSVGAWYGTPDWTFSIGGSVFNGVDSQYENILNSTNIIDIERGKSNDTGNGVPIWRVNFNYNKIDRVMSPTDFASSVSEYEKNVYGKEYSTIVVEDDSIKLLYPNSEELTIDSLLTHQPEAQYEATRLFNLYSEKRVTYTVTVHIDFATDEFLSFRIGYVARLQLDRFGLDLGKDFCIIGVESDYYSGIAKLTLWG